MGSWIIRPEAYFWRTVRALRDSQDCNAIQKSYIQQASLSLIVGSQDTLDCTSCCWSWQFSLAPPSFYFSLNPQFWFTQQLGVFFPSTSFAHKHSLGIYLPTIVDFWILFNNIWLHLFSSSLWAEENINVAVQWERWIFGNVSFSGISTICLVFIMWSILFKSNKLLP